MQPSLNNSVFANICNQLMNLNQEKPQINPTNYSEWKRHWVMDAIKGYRCGQSFCEYFGIPNSTPLYYFQDTKIAERWIERNYLSVK